jgi:hypothetical protein
MSDDVAITFSRRLIPLAPDEEQPSYMFDVDFAPEGYRLETDDEFRDRIKALINRVRDCNQQGSNQVKFELCKQCHIPNLCTFEQHCDLTFNGYR